MLNIQHITAVLALEVLTNNHLILSLDYDQMNGTDLVQYVEMDHFLDIATADSITSLGETYHLLVSDEDVIICHRESSDPDECMIADMVMQSVDSIEIILTMFRAYVNARVGDIDYNPHKEMIYMLAEKTTVNSRQSFKHINR